ncbi:hypothetical protein TanjilG_08486 [Lupinus angustifolius]|uniref:Uncharacterized protein n=1 Tax=Lupinus angustifolius TaxID=3871 RepID=A0A4P1R0T1_LUPAN|nr:hypothetical protein TanjilG_08486 [Lupinus angustifolius]
MERKARPLPLPTSQINLADHHLRPATDQSSPHVDQNRNKVMERRAHTLPLPPTEISVTDHSTGAANDQRSPYSDRERTELMERRAQPLPLPPTQINVVDHPLGPATDHCLGKPLPQQPQLAKQTRAPPRAPSCICSSAYRLLTGISRWSRKPRRTQARMRSNHPQTEVTPSTDHPTRFQGERVGSNVMHRSVSEESINSPVNLDCRGNQAVSSYQRFPISSKDAPNILRRGSKSQGPDDSVLKLANKRHDADGERENNKGRALKHQVQLNNHYETMKKAQRELDHKVRGNNSSKQEPWDMGYYYDVTNERDEGALAPWSARKVTSSRQEDRSKPRRVYLSEEMLKAKSGDNNQKGKTIGSSTYHGQESSLASNKNSLYELNSHEQSDDISDVLELLKQAKISLQQKINIGTSIQTSPLVGRSEGSGMPVRSSSLFQLPTDFSDDATARYNFRESNSQFGLNAYPGRDTSRNFYGNLGTNAYPGTMLTSADDRSIANRYMGTGSTFDPTRIPPHFSREAYTKFSSVDSTPESSPDISPGRGISGTSGNYPSLANGYIRPRPTFDPSTLPPRFIEETYARFNHVDSTPESSPNNSPGRGISGTSGGQGSTIPRSGSISKSHSDDGSLSTGHKETGLRLDAEGSPSVPLHLSSSKYMDPPTFPISPSYENATHSLPIVW